MGKGGAAFEKAIQIGRLDVFIAQSADGLISHIIGEDEEQIRLIRR